MQPEYLKPAFSTLGCPEWKLPSILEAAQSIGYRGIELRGGPEGHVNPELSPGSRHAISRMFSDSGIEAFAITAYTEFVDMTQKERLRQEDLLKEYIHLAYDLEAKYVRTFLGELGNPASRESQVKKAAESLGRVVEFAEPSGIEIAVETHDSWSSVSRLIPLIERVPPLRILWDIAHSLRAGDTLEIAYGSIENAPAYIHLKDEKEETSGGSVPVLPGEGSIPMKSIMSFLKEKKYHGYLCFEWERAWHPEIPPPEQALPAFMTWFSSHSGII